MDFIRQIRLYGIEYFNRYYSIYEGEVQDDEDPKNLGRLKIKVPEIYEGVLNKWVSPKGMFVGNQTGLFAIPAKGDNVWVTFQNGNPRFPIWEYGIIKESSVSNEVEELNSKLIMIKSRSGHKIILNDKDDKVLIEDSNKNLIEMNNKGVFINNDGGNTEPVVLGDIAEKLLLELIDDIGKIAGITTPGGPSGTINTSPLWQPLVSKWKSKMKTFKATKTNAQ